MENKKTEAEIQSEILLGLGKDFPTSVKAWRQNTGAVKFSHRFVQFGLKGQADISGILRGGVRLEIEVKTEKGKQSQSQKNFEAMINEFGGIYLLASDYEHIQHFLTAWLKKRGVVK